mmetsp:Transcript_51899/g.101653  ORF Transcript_51899/g.101653 Transcript_51899/m.101653 type:complete len:133 (-) Transcript_51899:721-1119(-)
MKKIMRKSGLGQEGPFFVSFSFFSFLEEDRILHSTLLVYRCERLHPLYSLCLGVHAIVPSPLSSRLQTGTARARKTDRDITRYLARTQEGRKNKTNGHDIPSFSSDPLARSFMSLILFLRSSPCAPTYLLIY